MKITINCEKALLALKNNKEDHLKDYAEQMVVFKKELTSYFEKQTAYRKEVDAWELSLSNIKTQINGLVQSRPIKDFEKPIEPKNYEASYDFYIGIFTAHIYPTMDLSESEFESIVLNKFGWRDSFYGYSPSRNINSIGYSGSAGFGGAETFCNAEEKVRQVQAKSVAYFMQD